MYIFCMYSYYIYVYNMYMEREKLTLVERVFDPVVLPFYHISNLISFI